MHRVTGHIEVFGERAGTPEGLSEREGGVKYKGMREVIWYDQSFRYT